MNTRQHAIRVGIRRGLTEFRLSLRSPEDLTFYLASAGGVLVYLVLNRNTAVEGTGLTLPTLILPGVLAAMIVFGGVVGPAFALVLEREDGTLLRSKAAPNGMVGYVTGQIVFQALSVLPMLLLVLLPCAFVLDGVMYRGVSGWLAVTGFVVLGLLASMPLGTVIGSLARKPSNVSTWGMFPIIGMAVISGIFTPITALPAWLQGVGQVFPMYWLGTAMRWAFLPDGASSQELGGTWHTPGAVLVLVAWTAVGLLLAPRVLKRMARRESGSAVEARRQERMQRVG